MGGSNQQIHALAQFQMLGSENVVVASDGTFDVFRICSESVLFLCEKGRSSCMPKLN